MMHSPSLNSTAPSRAWLQAFVAAISLPRVRVPDDFLSRAAGLFTEPRIYVENLRSLLDVSTPIAKALLGAASGRGLLKHKVLLLCPNPDCGRSLVELSFQDVVLSQNLPASLSCEICEQLERDRWEFDRAECLQLDVYEVIEAEASAG